MNTSTFAKLCGVEKRTLFYYDEIGLLVPSKKHENGYREYEPSQLEVMDNIKILQNAGYSLSEIKDIITAREVNRGRIFVDAADRLDEKIKKMQAMKAYLECKYRLLQQYNQAGETLRNEKVLLPCQSGRQIQDMHFFSFLQDGLQDIFMIRQDGAMFIYDIGARREEVETVSFFLKIEAVASDIVLLTKQKLNEYAISDSGEYFYQTIPHLLIDEAGIAIVKVMVKQ